MSEPAPVPGAHEVVRPPPPPAAGAGALDRASRALAWLERQVFGVSMLALLAAAGILTAGVFLRYFLKIPTDWQDEAAVFLIVGATFLCGSGVQAARGHVGIAALASALPQRWNRARVLLCDAVSLAFCTFFSWKSWKLLAEAVAEHQTTSSSWGPPLWIPYGVMGAGMTLLSVRLLLQLAAGLRAPPPRPARPGEGVHA